MYESINSRVRKCGECMKEKVTAIIPARAGSKGIPNKNIIDFCGKPLIAWSIEQAIQSDYVEDIYVSTDGKEIAEISEQYGAKIIWRPSNLASDTASSESAVLHAIGEIEKRHIVKSVLFLQPTSPIRLSIDIDNAVRIFLNKSYDSLFSMCFLEDLCIWKKTQNMIQSLTYDYQNRGRRQDREPLLLENGSIYVFKTEILKTYNNRLGGKIGVYEMPFDRSYEIDNLNDIETCVYFMRKYYGGE